MSKKYGDFSLDEIREINFSVGCILQDKKDLRPTAQKHLENIFNKTWSTIKYNQELQATRGY
jgi:hypothetical protein|tara:strand:+ start:19 stop:204 length:186 start_codon:yes stop_codon:yes gene_type:complete